jgi:hypothetical protein
MPGLLFIVPLKILCKVRLKVESQVQGSKFKVQGSGFKAKGPELVLSLSKERGVGVRLLRTRY